MNFYSGVIISTLCMQKKGKKETPELLEPLVGERSATKGIERFNTSRMYLPFEMAELEW